MSRQKLESLGLKLPLFPTTSVGSFPKPGYLAKARAEFNEEKISEESMNSSPRLI
jgi:methionine synthase II (cobalamin-independent)